MDDDVEVTTDQGEAATGAEKRLTQAEVDQIVTERLARQKAQYDRKFADYGDLKAKVEAGKSEAEKAIEQARMEGAQSVREKFESRLFEAEVRSRAAGLKFRDPGDALAQFGSRDGLVSEDGTVDGDAVSKRLSELANAKPYLTEADSTLHVASRPTLRRTGSTNTPLPGQKPGRAAEALRAFASGR